MNLTIALNLVESAPRIASRLSRALILTLCVFFLTAVPALADTVRMNQVQTLTSSNVPNIRLSTLVSQDPVSPGTKGATQQNGPRAETASVPGGTKAESIISGVTVTSAQQVGIDIIEEGEVEGTICDCGEILVAGGGFPKWPFLFLGAVPLVFISDCDDCDEPPRQESPTPTPTPTPPSTPTPTPPPPQVPEPASLLLFGSGLVAVGAGLRRRNTKSKLAAQVKGQEEE